MTPANLIANLHRRLGDLERRRDLCTTGTYQRAYWNGRIEEAELLILLLREEDEGIDTVCAAAKGPTIVFRGKEGSWVAEEEKGQGMPSCTLCGDPHQLGEHCDTLAVP